MLKDRELIFQEKYKSIKQITITTLVINFFLACAKLLGGIFGFSKALISDSVNSFGDVITSFIVLLGSKLASKKPDKSHPFGHERIESVTALIFEMIVMFIAIMLGVSAIQTLIEGPKEIQFDYLSIIVASICIGIKLALFIVAFINYKKTHSSILKAQMIDHFFDSIGTTVSLFAIIISKYFGIWWIDSAATLVIVVLISLTAIKVMIDTISCLVDRSWTDEKIKEVEEIVLLYKDIKSIDLIKSRKFGDRIYLEMEVSMDKNLTLDFVHKIIDDIHNEIEQKFIEVIHISIHVNPYID